VLAPLSVLYSRALHYRPYGHPLFANSSQGYSELSFANSPVSPTCCSVRRRMELPLVLYLSPNHLFQAQAIPAVLGTVRDLMGLPAPDRHAQTAGFCPADYRKALFLVGTPIPRTSRTQRVRVLVLTTDP